MGTRRVVLFVVLLIGIVIAGCGEEDAARPAAATDTTVQPAEPGAAPAGAKTAATGVLRGSYKRLNGERDDLARYRGKVVLVVNTATECGYTPQLEGLEALHRERRAAGLVVLGFPANDFAGQEPRSDKEIATFCKANYGVSFPMFSKSRVLGEQAAPLYKYLKAEKPGLLGSEAIKWNFTKFLVDREGNVVKRYAPNDTPESIAKDVEKLL